MGYKLALPMIVVSAVPLLTSHAFLMPQVARRAARGAALDD